MNDASSFRASGNEPGWRLDITEDSMTLLLDNGQSRVAVARPPVQMTGDRRRYATTAAGRSLTASVADSICSDTMTGMPYPTTVVVEFGDRTLRGCGGDPAALLRGGEWVVEDLDGGGMIDGSRVTLQFGDDGRISGRASCNRYFGAYTLTGERLAVSQLGATKMACAPALMTQESSFFDLLGNTQRFSVSSDGALILHTADGRTLTARRG
jgi:heat shock protein HslJ